MKIRDLIADMSVADDDEDVVVVFQSPQTSERLADGDVLNIEDTGFSAAIGNKGAHVLYVRAYEDD